ncbi:MAG: hypothetical protein CM15mP65_15930 [Crocinitomicaceae bacterium]|nr:MAG: hypothetical protein CM15mP65_15930 [Crocinitomicaceae bacterium]
MPVNHFGKYLMENIFIIFPLMRCMVRWERMVIYEETPYDPRSPYSASKASSDHIVRAYGHTYQLPIKISNCSNNYGSFQFPEKLIPLMINK